MGRGARTLERWRQSRPSYPSQFFLGGGAKDMRDPPWLASQGVPFLLRGHHTFTASVQAIHDTMQALRDGVEPEDVTGIATQGLMRTITNGEEYARQSKEWL